MRLVITTLGTLILFALILGCGKNENTNSDDSSSGEYQKNEQSSQSEPSNPLEQFGQALEEAGEAISGNDTEPVPPVHFKTLISFLPSSCNSLIPSEPEGETASFGKWKYSKAEITFKGEAGTYARVEITDYAYIKALIAPIKMLFSTNFEKESTRGYEKSRKVQGFPARDNWKSRNLRHEITVLVDRFIVTVTTRMLEENVAPDLLNEMNLSALASTTAT